MSVLNASLLAWSLSFGGMAALAFALDRHYGALIGVDEVPALQRVVLRGGGALFLLAALVPAVQGWSSSVGVVVVLGFWTLGALLVAGLMAWSPRVTAWVALVAALAGMGGVFAQMVQ